MISRARVTGFPIRIALADDHAILREALKVLLDQHEGVEFIAEYANGRDAVAGALTDRPEVLLMDLAMPQLNGIDATRQIKRDAPAVKVIIISSIVNADEIRSAIHAGAAGYLSKHSHADELLLAIQTVHRGNSYYSADIAAEFDVAALIQEASTTVQRPPVERLTNREREVLQLLVEGYTSKRIAAELIVSTKTVEGHKSRMMEKFQLHSRTDLIRYAIRNGIIMDEEPRSGTG